MELSKVKTRSSKRVGRGYGSGKGGHTSSRGMKGQKSRSANHILFEGVKMRKSLLSRLPLLRGKDKFKAKSKPLNVSLSDLDTLKDGSKVTVDLLVKEGIVKESEVSNQGVKVLGNGDLGKKLTVHLLTTKSAREAIEKAGGSVAQ